MNAEGPEQPPGINQGTFKYYAFISYNRSDVKWAKWLQKKLESYRLPSFLRKRHSHLPKRLRPIFRDQTDLGVAPLEKGLREELRDSRYLIVVCSPAAARSEWVNKEVQDFIGMGRAGSIIPFIVGGEPNSPDPERECYPPALRQISDQILGASVEELGRQKAFVRIVAAILSLKFDELWQRHRRRERLKQVMMGAVAAGIAVACFLWWDYASLKVSYYEDYVTRWGIPEGVRPLATSEFAGRNTSWRIETQKRQVRRVVCVNSADRATNPLNWELAERPSDQRFAYRDDGRLLHVDIYAPNQKFLFRSKYEEIVSGPDGIASQVVSYWLDKVGRRPKFLTAGKTGLETSPLSVDKVGGDAKGKITKVQITYTPEGWVAREEFFDLYGNPAEEKNKIFGKVHARDKEGLLLQIGFLDDRGQKMRDSRGIAGIEYKYDGRRRLLQTTFVAMSGEPFLSEGVAKRSLTFDRHGNLIKVQFYGPDDKPSSHKDGVAGFMAKYDERGNTIEVACFGVDGKPCLHKDGIALWQSKYDDRGNEIEKAYFGVDRKPCLDKAWNAGWRAKYDERGNTIEVACFGVDGKPCLHKDGIALWQSKYDDRGNEIEKAYFGVDRKPCLDKAWNAGWRAKYDERGNTIEVAAFGVDGKPCLHKDGYAILRAKYDERGNKIEVAAFGVDGKPCFNKDRHAILRAKYDERGNTIEVAYFGVDGKPCLHKDGYAIMRAKYDERGNEIESAYFEADGKPCLHKYGIAVWRRKYDERGNVTEQAYFGVDGKPCLGGYGYAILRTKYDERGNRIESAYFGVYGKPCLHKDGYAVWRAKYDDRGNHIESAYFGVDGTPCLHKDGNAVWRAKYDDRGNHIESAYFGVDGTPCVHKAGTAVWRRKYDERGNETERAYFGVDGKPCLGKDGYAVRRAKYDERGNEVEVAYFDAEGKACLHRNGWAVWRRKYDERGKEIEWAYFGVDGTPCLHKDGNAIQRAKYDERGNKIEVAAFGVDGKPCQWKNGHALWRATYNDLGKVVEESYFGVDGKPFLRKDGYALWRAKYDDRGNKIQLAHFGLDGKPCMTKYGYSSYREERDDLGNLVKRVYVDLDGKTVRTVGSSIMMNQKGVVIVAGPPDSPADTMGIQQGDILLEVADWRFFPQRDFDESLQDLNRISGEEELKTKKVVMFRPSSSSIIQCDLGSGPTGMRWGGLLWPGDDLKGVQQAYERFVRDTNAAGEKGN